MTHSFDFSAASEKLFVLQQLHAASRDYAHQVKPIVSGYMIESAAKVRIFQDSMSRQIRPSVFERADKYALEDIPLGKVHSGNFKLSVRE